MDFVSLISVESGVCGKGTGICDFLEVFVMRSVSRGLEFMIFLTYKWHFHWAHSVSLNFLFIFCVSVCSKTVFEGRVSFRY